MGGLAALAREAGHRVTGCDANVYPPMSDQLRGARHRADRRLRRRPARSSRPTCSSSATRSRAATRWSRRSSTPAPPTPAARSGWPSTCCRAATCSRSPARTARPRRPRCSPGSSSTAGRAPGFLVGGVPLDFGVSARLRRPGGAVRDRGRRVRHRVLRQAQQVRPLPAAHRDPQQPRVRPRRHLRRPGGDRAPVPSPRAHRAGAAAGWSSTRATRRCSACSRWAAGASVQRFGARKEEPGMLRARGEPHAFDVLRGGLKVARVEWPLLGEHNQLNALAAIAAAEHVGVAPDAAARGARRASATSAPARAARRASAASPSTTTSRTTRPRCARPSTACAARSARRASSPSSSRARTR